MQHFRFVNSWFRFLISWTGYTYWFISSSLQEMSQVILAKAFFSDIFWNGLEQISWKGKKFYHSSREVKRYTPKSRVGRKNSTNKCILLHVYSEPLTRDIRGFHKIFLWQKQIVMEFLRIEKQRVLIIKIWFHQNSWRIQISSGVNSSTYWKETLTLNLTTTLKQLIQE